MIMFTLNKVVTALALCSTLALSSYAIAKPEQGGNKQKMKRMFAALSVTDTQKQDIRQIMKQGLADTRVNMLDTKAVKPR
jgi:Spy/CpxP family protein refolding chaperone